jgi:hypothetical protein
MYPKTLHVVCMMLASLLGSGVNSALAQDSGARAIEGVWAVSITLRDCSTNAPLGPPFRALLTFHQGGTLSESAATAAFAPGQRTSGHGTWANTGGSTYTSRFVAAIIFETAPSPPASPGFLTGWQIISQTATLTDADHLTSVGQVQFYDVDGNVYRVACPTSVGERFK